AINTANRPAMANSQRFSVRATSSAGTIPSGSGRRRGLFASSANGASRKKQEKIESKPSDQEQSGSDTGDDECTAGTMPKRGSCGIRTDGRRDMFGQCGGRGMIAGHMLRHGVTLLLRGSDAL